MNRDEIYDHLARVYLDKREVVEKKQPKRERPLPWLVINIVITGVILSSIVWGFTAFFAQRDDLLKSRVMFTLNNSPITLVYNVGGKYPQVKELTIAVPEVDATKYRQLNLSVKGSASGNPGMLKVVLTNARQEKASYYLRGIKSRWQDYSISFDQMDLADWRTVRDISFVVEAWNAGRATGAIYIDNISFSN
jgi:hypothetical protein